MTYSFARSRYQSHGAKSCTHKQPVRDSDITSNGRLRRDRGTLGIHREYIMGTWCVWGYIDRSLVYLHGDTR